MTQVREVLRAWLAGAGKRPAARRAGVDVKTAARYIRAAQAAGLARDGDESQLTDELLGQVVAAVRPARPAGHGAVVGGAGAGDGRDHRVGEGRPDAGEDRGAAGAVRDGGAVPDAGPVRRGRVRVLSSSRPGVTVPVADGKPGEEVQLDFGYLGMIADGDRRRKLHALVFTAVLSRYCFVYLTFSQTTAAVIAGCEAAWAFFGGMFTVLIPDNLKPVVDKADRLEPRWNREWLEYAQARGLVVDPARVRSPQDKGRVENGVKFAQRSFFAGEQFADLADAQRRAGGLVPGAGGDAGARHHPAAARRGVRAAGGAGAAARAGAAVPGAGVERGQSAARFPCPGAERVLLGALPAGRAAGHGAGGRDAGEDLPPRPGGPHPPAAAGGRPGVGCGGLPARHRRLRPPGRGQAGQDGRRPRRGDRHLRRPDPGHAAAVDAGCARSTR